jgi:hypothetical protein
MTFTELLPKILLALVTTVFSDVYKRVCRWLTNRGNKCENHFLIRIFCRIENYQEQRVHDDQMIAKLFAVNIFFLNTGFC